MIINYNNLDPLLLKIQTSMLRTKFILTLKGFPLMPTLGILIHELKQKSK